MRSGRRAAEAVVAPKIERGASAVIVFLLHALATGIMVGVIWVVQLVHYPLFAQVGETSFVSYHQAHVRLISYIVMPAMLLELGGAIGAVRVPLPSGIPRWACFGPGAGYRPGGPRRCTRCRCTIGWRAGFDGQAHAALVATNWARTLAWSARGGWLVDVVSCSSADERPQEVTSQRRSGC